MREVQGDDRDGRRGAGELGAAEAGYAEAAELLRGIDAPGPLAHAIRHLGDLRLELGDPEAARRCHEEALALLEGLDPPRPLDHADAVRSLAVLEEEVGDLAAAARRWREAHARYARLSVGTGSRRRRRGSRA